VVKVSGIGSSWLAALVVTLVAGAAAADPLSITASPNPAPAGVAVTFTFTPRVNYQDDSVTFDFGDGGTATVVFEVGCTLFGGCGSIAHTYAGAGVFIATANGSIGGQPVSGSLQIVITASTSDSDLYLPTGAHLTGFNNVNWRTDVEIQNPGPARASYLVSLLVRNADNSTPAFQTTFALDPDRSARYNDILYGTFGFSGAAAIRITPILGHTIVTSRTYNQLPSGTYSQSVPAIPRAQAIGFSQDAFLIGLSHDPTLAAGYRTNLGFVNASPASIHVEAEFYLASGSFLGKTGYDLRPFEFFQKDKAFEEVTSDEIEDGYIIVRTTTAGAKFFAYAVVTDNVTGDPTYVNALVPQ
jgi:hypothetical protein